MELDRGTRPLAHQFGHTFVCLHTPKRYWNVQPGGAARRVAAGHRETHRLRMDAQVGRSSSACAGLTRPTARIVPIDHLLHRGLPLEAGLRAFIARSVGLFLLTFQAQFVYLLAQFLDALVLGLDLVFKLAVAISTRKSGSGMSSPKRAISRRCRGISTQLK